MNCPFCNEELELDEYDLYCMNCNYNKNRCLYGNEEMWQELIRTRKALEIAVKGLKHIRGTCLSYTADYMDAADNILEQITALEQKDVK